MPIPGIGVAPTGNLYNELNSVVRRAFVRRLFVQIYFASPSLFYLWGNSQRAAGGLNQVTIPMQGQSMVQGSFTGYGGGFNQAAVIPGIQNGQWNLAYWVVPIPLPFGETVLQATEREISLLKARMNDAYAVTRQNVASLLYRLNSANPLYPNSFLDAFDNGTNTPTYGGINRNAAGNSAFKGQYINAGAGTTWDTKFSTSTLGWKRAGMSSRNARTSHRARDFFGSILAVALMTTIVKPAADAISLTPLPAVAFVETRLTSVVSAVAPAWVCVAPAVIESVTLSL